VSDEVEKILLAITYLESLLRDAKRRGDEELVKYVGGVIRIYKERLQSQNSNN